MTRATATGVIAIWMLLGGTLHLVTPETFFPIVPEPYWASLRIVVQLALIGMGLYLWRGARRA